MKTEALKLADELEALHQYVPSEAPAMIRRLVEELDKQSKPVGVYDGKSLHIYTPQTKPLSDEQIINIWLPFATDGIKGKIEFARAIEERHGIK
jgi:hypothetical protein